MAQVPAIDDLVVDVRCAVILVDLLRAERRRDRSSPVVGTLTDQLGQTLAAIRDAGQGGAALGTEVVDLLKSHRALLRRHDRTAEELRRNRQRRELDLADLLAAYADEARTVPDQWPRLRLGSAATTLEDMEQGVRLLLARSLHRARAGDLPAPRHDALLGWCTPLASTVTQASADASIPAAPSEDIGIGTWSRALDRRASSLLVATRRGAGWDAQAQRRADVLAWLYDLRGTEPHRPGDAPVDPASEQELSGSNSVIGVWTAPLSDPGHGPVLHVAGLALTPAECQRMDAEALDLLLPLVEGRLAVSAVALHGRDVVFGLTMRQLHRGAMFGLPVPDEDTLVHVRHVLTWPFPFTARNLRRDLDDQQLDARSATLLRQLLPTMADSTVRQAGYDQEAGWADLGGLAASTGARCGVGVNTPELQALDARVGRLLNKLARRHGDQDALDQMRDVIGDLADRLQRRAEERQWVPTWNPVEPPLGPRRRARRGGRQPVALYREGAPRTTVRLPEGGRSSFSASV